MRRFEAIRNESPRSRRNSTRSIERNSDALIKLEQEGEAIRHRLPDLLKQKEAVKDEVTMKKQELEELEERYSRRHIGRSRLDL